MKLFETIKIENNKIFNIKYHNYRFNKTQKELFNIQNDIDLLKFIEPKKELTKCKIIYEKEILDIIYEPYIFKKRKNFKLIKSDIKYDYKFLDRKEIDFLFLQKQECDDIIIYDKFLKDTSIANIAIKLNNLWLTPKTPLLKGSFRHFLLEYKKITEADITIQMLYDAQSFAIMNAMIGFVEIDAIFKE